MLRRSLILFAMAGALALPSSADAGAFGWSSAVNINNGTTNLTSISYPSSSLCVAMAVPSSRRCVAAGTLVRVAVGAVSARDLRKRRNVVVRAPGSYFAAP